MTSIDIYRPGSPPTLQATVNIDERTLFSKKLMGDHVIVGEFISSTILDIAIGDYLTYDSESYFVNRLPSIEKINNSTYKYSVRFEGIIYNLNRKLLISGDSLCDFSYNGSASDFIDLIISNINEIDGTPVWSAGTVDSSEDITLQFSNETCRAALTRVAEAFKMEFSLSGKEISLLNSVGSDTAYSFQYGKDLGLYKLTRQQVSDQNILTKVYGFGATKNIPYEYRDGAKRLTFAASGTAASGYLVSAASGLYGIIEGQFTDDNIFPNRTGTITSVSYTAASGWGNSDYIVDSAMDFDVNDYLIEGQTATMVFKSGDNSGVECEIWKYVDATKRFYITPFKEADGYTQPNTLNYPASGDTYTLINMSMPQTYIDTAETALQAATQDYLDENDAPMVVYSVDIDPKYASSVGLSLDVGDKVTVVDTDLGIDALIRVSGIEFPLVNPYQIKATIADFVPYTLQERIVKATISTIKETVFVDRRREEQARRNTVNLNTTKDLIFDTDGYFDTGNIKPLSIETAYMAVGTKSRDFWLSGVTIKANYEGDANALYASAGSLVHLQIEIAGLGYTWVIGTPLDQDSLTPATPYYLYAKCSNAALTGEWVLSSSQITVEQVTGYYHFLVGMLFAVNDGYRDFDFSYGMTYINGNTITTGKIQSIDTNNFFDLTDGKFRIGAASGTYIDYNSEASGVLTVKGAAMIDTVVSNMIMSEYATIANLGVQYFAGVPVDVGDLAGSGVTLQSAGLLTPQIDRVTLTGTDGTAEITCDAITKVATYFNSLTETVEGFVDLWYDDYYRGGINSGVTISASGESVVFTGNGDNLPFIGATSITNIPNPIRGAINIEGNEIWENEENDDFTGTVNINKRGYQGGVTKYRTFNVFDGKNNLLAVFEGGDGGGYVDLFGAEFNSYADTVYMNAASGFRINNLASGVAGLTTGMIYRDGTTIKIVP